MTKNERTKSSSPFSQKNIPLNYNFSCILSETLTIVFSLLLILTPVKPPEVELLQRFLCILQVIKLINVLESYTSTQSKGTVWAFIT